MLDATLHRLFFAIRPPPDRTTQIGGLRDAVRERGSVVSDERLHVSLFVFDDYPALPAGLADGAIAAASGVVAAPFYILFEQLVAGKGSTLLSPSEPLPALIAFQERLAAALADGALAPRRRWSFRPHITLFYGNRCAAAESIEPISWLVKEFVLIHSHVGERRHVTLARSHAGRCSPSGRPSAYSPPATPAPSPASFRRTGRRRAPRR